MARVHILKNPLMMNPPRMHLISEIPEPAAYGANDLTSFPAEYEKRAYVRENQKSLVSAIRRLGKRSIKLTANKT
jgi:hypothetical protein